MSFASRLGDWWRSYTAAREQSRRLAMQRDERERYQRELGEWQEESGRLQQEIELAAEPTGFTGMSERVPVVLHKGEGVFLVSDGAILVEPERTPGHWANSYSGVSFRVMKGVRYHVGGSRGQYIPGEEVTAAMAIGTVTITNQRVAFQSDKEAREFAFSKLIGYQHDPEKPLTYFQVSNRKKVSGIGYSAQSARLWRLRLAVALAHFRGEVPALIEHLRAEAAEHEAAKPKAPVLRVDGNMQIKVACANCGKSLHAKSDFAGKRVKCPACKHAIDIPAGSQPMMRPSSLSSQLPWLWIVAGTMAVLLAITLPFVIHSLSKSTKAQESATAGNQETMQPLAAPATKGTEANTAVRLVPLEKCREFASKQVWATSIQQIPATVIDRGILKNVPYQSFKCGDYELNIYGDPDRPACLEIGVRNELLKNTEAKNNCVEFIKAMLDRSDDRAILLSLKRDKDLKKQAGMTFEITPETDEDAYGGWWVSVYDEALLDASRASEKELNLITQSKEQIKQPVQPSKRQDPPGWSADDLKNARPAPSAGSQASGGQVYVKGYTKKDGTYVQSHTRSAPSHGKR